MCLEIYRVLSKIDKKIRVNKICFSFTIVKSGRGKELFVWLRVKRVDEEKKERKEKQRDDKPHILNEIFLFNFSDSSKENLILSLNY